MRCSLSAVTLLVAAFWTAGCAGPRRTADVRPGLPERFPDHSLQEIQTLLQPASDTLASFKAKASLTVRTPQQNASLSADLRHRRGDSLYMSVSPGLGIEAARVLVTPDSFFVHDRIKKRFIYGSLAYASSFLPAPLAGEDLFRSLLGLATPDPGVAWELDSDEAHYYLHAPAGDMVRRYTVDPRVWRVVGYEERRTSGELVEKRSFSEHDLIDGWFLPRRVVLERPLDDSSVTLFYRDLDLNPEGLSMRMRVGDDVDRVLADEQGPRRNE